MEDIHDLKPPIETPVLTQNLIYLFWVFCVVILLLIAACLIFYFWKKNRQNKEEEAIIQEEEAIDYQAIIADKFSVLKGYIEKGELKDFYLEASKLLREYLAYKYNDNFSDMTASEILANKKISKAQRSELKNFFFRSDLVKFAGQEASVVEAENIYLLLKSIIG